MSKRARIFLTSLTLILMFGATTATVAQETTASVRGTVQSPSGTPAAGAVVTITDTRTGSTRRVTTTNNGLFNIRGLLVGGPYTIQVDSDEYRGTVIHDVFANLSSASRYNFVLENKGAIEEVVVVSSALVRGADVASGPSTSFSFEEIEALPTINRNIRDVIRLDPRVNIGRSGAGGGGFGISCLGGSAKANSFTIDGVRVADGFGLNDSGNSARNTFPVPFDTVRAASVEFAPIDVQYGQFTGCNINVVTKSGTNEFSGSAFYLFNDESLTGDTLDGRTVISEPFEDKNWGFEFGGPIIKDTLFFYLAYEETDGGGAQSTGPIGGGFANERFLTVEDANRIADILRSQYDRDPGEIVRTLPAVSERKFIRIDWNINDNHRLEGSYVDLEESNLRSDGLGFNGFTFSDNFQVNGTVQEQFSVRLFSNWTDRLSTEIKFSSLDVADLQDPFGGGEAQNDNKPRLLVQDGAGNTILTSGPGEFRSANDLQYTLEQIKIKADYVIGDHTLTFGFEQESLDIFNLFVSDATGRIVFDSIEDLEAGIASLIRGNGSFSGDINDAAASFSRDINALYFQDQWMPSNRLTITAGIRYDWFESSDVPSENPVFEQRYGFKNTQAFNGLDVVLPRVGLTYDLPYSKLGEIQLRAGFGIFTGSDPTVSFANSFQNTGGAIGFGASFIPPCTAADLNVLSSGSFNGIPPCIAQGQQNQANTNTGRVAATDPDFDLPTEQRWNIGASLISVSEIDFFNDWEVQLDYIYSNHKNSRDWIDLTLTQRVDANGQPIFLPDGRPQFFAIDPLLEGCDATFAGIGNGFNNVTTACDAGTDDQDVVMTNGLSGSTTSISVQLNKLFQFGDKTSLNFRFGYAYTDTKAGNPGTNSTATSSFEEVAVAVLNQVELGPSFWTNKHNFVVGTTFKHYFFADHPTSIGVFFRRRSGRPFSYAYDNNTPTSLFGDSDNEERNLFYVPSGRNDPIIDLTRLDQQGTTDDFFAFLESTGLNEYAGQISPKNGFTGPWNSDMDIRISQDIPLPGWNHSLKLFFDIENVLNLFSDSQNVTKFFDSGDVNEGLPVMDAALSPDGTQFVLSNFNPGGSKPSDFNPIRIDTDDSVWRIQLGIRYQFN